MAVTLETLELSPETLAACKDTIQRMAYFNWLNANCPENRSLEFWVKAEQDWLSHFYVPDREVDGVKPIQETECSKPTVRMHQLINA